LVEAKALSGYEVYLRFADGLAADVDLSYLLDFGGVFEPLRDVEFFRELTIDDGGNTVVGPTKPTSRRRLSTTTCSAPSTRSGAR
jgi:hypothetical protein